VRVDGPDYRHRGLPDPPAPSTEDEIRARAAASPDATLDDFGELLRYLAGLHPSRYGALVEGVSAVHLLGVHPAPDQNVALRLVVLADRLYDRQVPVLASGQPLDRIFDEDMLAGGYRKKYRRAISRLIALNRIGAEAGAADGRT
jgi:cell division protein ZapE